MDINTLGVTLTPEVTPIDGQMICQSTVVVTDDIQILAKKEAAGIIYTVVNFELMPDIVDFYSLEVWKNDRPVAFIGDFEALASARQCYNNVNGKTLIDARAIASNMPYYIDL